MRARFAVLALPLVCALAFAAVPTSAAAVDLQIYGGGTTAAVGSAAGGTVAVTGSGSSTGVAGNTLTMSSRFTGSQYGGALLFRPFWPAPIAVGAFVLQQQYRGSQAGVSEDFKGTQVGPEAMAWVPLPIVQPYLRGGYDASGNYTYTATAQTAGAQASVTGAVRGYHAAAGLRLTLVGPLGVFVEAAYARATDAAPELVMQSHAFVVGLGGGL